MWSDEGKRVVWKFTNSAGKVLPPLLYSNGKTQEDVILEVLEVLDDEEIVFLKGGVGTGKSVIALHVIDHYGKGIISVPTKKLERQYHEDYCTGNFRIQDESGALDIQHLMGKTNFGCWYDRSHKCGHNSLPCSRRIRAGETRIKIASVCEYWSPVYSPVPASKDMYLRDHDEIDYESITGLKTFLKAPTPCPYYEQFDYFTRDNIAMIFNSAKWEVETWIGRKPRVPIEIIDEGDAYLDSLSYRTTISTRFFTSVKNEGLVALDRIIRVEKAFKLLIGNEGNYEGALKGEILAFVQFFIDVLGGASTSGRVCDRVTKMNLINKYSEVSHAKISSGVLTVFIPKPDITLRELRDKSGKMVIMSATQHTIDILTDIFKVKNPVIVLAEERFAGMIYIKKTGREMKVTNRSWKSDPFKMKYWDLLDYIISIAREPILVQVHAFKYLPEKYKGWNNEERVVMGKRIKFATDTDRGVDLRDDLCRTIVIMKYPLPNIADIVLKVMRKSLGDPRFWKYVGNMADRDIVQQCGRAVRHKDDWCDIYLLDTRAMSRLVNLWEGAYMFMDLAKNNIIKVVT